MLKTYDGLRLHGLARLEFTSSGPSSYFFGYYDPSPINHDETRVLCHAVGFDGRMVSAQDYAEVGYWDLESSEFVPIAQTSAFNWQQGAMLRWFPGSKGARIVFNDRFSNQFAARIIDVETRAERILPTTVYSMTTDGRYAVTPRFERLYYCRPGYNYLGIEEAKWFGDAPPDDGLLCVNLEDETVDLVVETKLLTATQRLPSMQDSMHYVEHVMLNPSGTHALFYHRWQTQSGDTVTRLYTVRLDGSELCLYTDSGFYSHANWLNDSEFVVWGRPVNAYTQVRHAAGIRRALLNPLLKVWRRHMTNPMLSRAVRGITRDSYLRFVLDNPAGVPVGRTILTRDGHPSVNPVFPWLMLTDTYQDEHNERHLLLFDLRNDDLVHLASVRSSPDFDNTGFRCDLHPRWSPTGRKICIDMYHGAGRQIAILDVSAIIRSTE